MMAFPYAGSSLTMCKISRGKTSRVLTSLRKMSLGVVLSIDRPAALSIALSLIEKLVKIDNNTDNKFA
jgi:hypothetical protein